MEKWDVLDEFGNLTGEVTERKADFYMLGDKKYHLVVVAWIYKDGMFLIQQRSLNKMIDPGIWSIPGGSATSGETSLDACIREISEEMGVCISAEQMIHIKRYKRKSDFCDAWFVDGTQITNIEDFDETEVDDVRWERPGNIINMMEDGMFSAHWDILDALKFTEVAKNYEKK